VSNESKHAAALVYDLLKRVSSTESHFIVVEKEEK
jgi:hypothetical protein